MDGIDHEFQSVENVLEDVTDIVLNLKKVLLNCHKREPVTLTLNVEKGGEITAGDIDGNADVEVSTLTKLFSRLTRNAGFCRV